jgi:hypothetical protein
VAHAESDNAAKTTTILRQQRLSQDQMSKNRSTNITQLIGNKVWKIGVSSVILCLSGVVAGNG